MIKLICNCLNVKICIRNSDFQTLNVTSKENQPESQHVFFSMEVAEVQLNLEGITVEHPSLLRKHRTSSWLVHECVSCQMMTHAVPMVQANNNTVLVNKQLKKDASTVDCLHQSPNYSPLYKVILSNRADNSSAQHMNKLGVQRSGKYEALETTLSIIQQQLNQFLIDEEASMEERIRHYEQTQRAAYAELQSKARRDKNTLISLVLAAEHLPQQTRSQQAGGKVTTDGAHTAPVSQPENMETVSHPPPSPDTLNSNRGNTSPSVTSPDGKIHSTATRHMHTTQKKPQQYYSGNIEHGSPDADGVFDFDPAFSDDRDRPFYESEEETEDTDDSSVTEESEQTCQQGNKPFFSTSVPISMPVWPSLSKRTSELPEHEEREPAPDMDNMAASIKALARSVHGDGADIFGERPRPRLNMKDFGNM